MLPQDERAVGQMSELISLPIISPRAAYVTTPRAFGLLRVCALPNVFKACVKPALIVFAEFYWFTFYSRWVGFPSPTLSSKL